MIEGRPRVVLERNDEQAIRFVKVGEKTNIMLIRMSQRMSFLLHIDYVK